MLMIVSVVSDAVGSESNISRCPAMEIEMCHIRSASRIRRHGTIATNHAIQRLVGAAGVLAIGTALAEPSHRLATECALREIKVITLIEDHGAAGDIPSDKLAAAGAKMFEARSICYEGRVGKALALYDSILSLGPAVTGKSR
jgi:hypothetical protein